MFTIGLSLGILRHGYERVKRIEDKIEKESEQLKQLIKQHRADGLKDEKREDKLKDQEREEGEPAVDL